MKITIFISILALSVSVLFAQTDQKNLLKYWYYRDRLLKDFMTCVCDENGGSLPASYRDNRIVDPQNNQPSNAFVKWGDGTIDLAYYIGTLALEYKLLSSSGQNTQQTVKELYYAIEAINRLDRNADISFNTSEKDWYLNGFFIRSDVGMGSPTIQEIKDKINTKNDDVNFLHQEIGSIESEFTSGDNAFLNLLDVVDDFHNGLITYWQFIYGLAIAHRDIYGNAESQDQVIHLLTGLAFVIDLLPPTLKYEENNTLKNFYHGIQFPQPYFVQEAKNIVDRMVYYMHADDYKWNWVLHIPGTQDEVPRGAGALELSIGFAKVQYALTAQENEPGSNLGSIAKFWYAKRIWETFNNEIVNDLANGENSKWLELKTIIGVDDMEEIAHFSIRNSYKFHFIPMMYKALHSNLTFGMYEFTGQWTYNTSPKAFIKDMIDEAPCYGPYNYSTATQIDYPSREWSSTSRNIHPERRGERPPAFKGDYNGIDYMFFHNLYRYIYQSESELFIKCSNVSELTDYPFFNSFSPPTGFGSHASPTTIESFNTIVANNKVNTDGDVTYRASISITLGTGFQVASGADFLVYIDPIECLQDKISFQRLSSNAYYDPNNNSSSYSQDLTLNGKIVPNPTNSDGTIYIDLEDNSEILVKGYDVFGKSIIGDIRYMGMKGENHIDSNK